MDAHFSKEEYVTYKEWLAKNVGVSQYELWTRLVVMKTKKAAGFMGWTRYELEDKESEWNKTTHILVAKYAEYVNMDGNKTATYGQTKLGSPLASPWNM